MSIYFTQFLRPYGRQKLIKIDRSNEIEKIAEIFIGHGGWFECEVLSDGDVSLTACFKRRNGDNDIAIEIVPNGPEVPLAVDKLLLEVDKFLTRRGTKMKLG
jgi:hypothetical protein